MARWLRWLFGKAWLLAAVAAILAAVVTVAARQLLPLVPQYRTEIEQAASTALGRPVRIGGIQVGWDWLTPQVRLENVRILRAPQGAVLFRLASVGLEFDILHSLLERRPVPATVVLRGAWLKVDLARDGQVSLAGVPLALPGGGGAAAGARGAAPAGLAGVTLELDRANVLFSDARSGQDYRLRDLSAALRVDGAGNVFLAGGAHLPARLGRRLSFVAELHGLLGGAQAWGGRIYLDLGGGRLDAPPLREFAGALPPLRGELNARLWTRWEAGQLRSASGHVQVAGFALGGGAVSEVSAAAPAALTRLSADFAWTRTAAGWQVAAKQVRAGSAQGSWPVAAFSLAESAVPGGRRLYGWADFLRLQDLAPLLAAQPALPAALGERLQALAPHGDVSALRFDVKLPRAGAPQASVSARFANLSLQPDGNIPGVRGASGALRATPAGGTLVLDSPALVLEAPKLFAADPPAAAAHGRIDWAARPGGWAVRADAFSVSNADVSVRGQFGLWLPGAGPPYLNLLLHMNRGEVAAAHRYLPARLFPADLNHWLNTALVGGRVTEGDLVLRGDPTHFPFRQHDGVFEARLQVSDGTLAYFENWPRLSGLQGEVVFDGASLHVDASRGRILDTRIAAASLDIADMEKARLDIRGGGEGPLADVPTYLAYTPLGDGRQALFQEIRSRGHERFSLNVVLPLTGGQLRNWSLHGTSQVSDGYFALPAHDFALSAIDGRIDFTQRSLSAAKVGAVFRGQPVQVAASTRADGLATLTLDGHYSVAGLLGKDSPVTQFAHGDADVRLAFTLPMTPAAFRRFGTGITLASDLGHVAVDLPAPLGKKSGTQRGFVLRFSVARPETPIRVRYGNALQAVLKLAGGGQCRYLAAADIRYDRGAPKLPAAGITLEAKVPEIDVDAWRALQGAGPATPSASPSCPDSTADMLGRVRSLNVEAGRARVLGRDFRNVKVDARRAAGEWRATVASDALSGRLRIPLDLHGAAPLRFDLSHLAVAAARPAAPSSAAPPLNPAELPPLSGHIARLDIAGRRIDGVSLTTTPLDDGLQIHQLQIEEPNLQARVTGDWRRSGGSDRTRLQVELRTDDAGKALRKLQLSSALSGGSGQASAALNWSGSPFDLNWKTLTGQASLTLSGGRLNEIDPGQTGRLLGLFNLSQLPTRLTHGFGDLFQKGFAFNTLKGDFQFRRGDLYTQNLAIAGASANIGVKGRVGIVARDYDANVTVLPQVESALPIAGAVVGGPAAGAVVYLLDRVFGIGKQLNKAAEIRYHVGGSWDAPKIEVESVPSSSATAPRRRNGSSNPY